MIKWIKELLCWHVKDITSRKSTGIYRMRSEFNEFPEPEYCYIVWKKCMKCGKEFVEYEWYREPKK